MKKSIIIIAALSLVLGGCASLSDCNGLSQPAYSDCVSRVNSQNAAAAAVGGALLGIAAGAAAAYGSQPYYSPSYSTTTCVGDRRFSSCSTTRY